MADEAFVFVKRVLLAKETLLVLRFRMANPAAVFVSFVLLAPEPAFFAELRIANEAVCFCDLVWLAHLGFGTGLFLVPVFVLRDECLAGREHQERAKREQ